MRINRFLALSTSLSRRAADRAISEGRVLINNQPPALGQNVLSNDIVTLNGKELDHTTKIETIILNKPVGYVCSRDGQGNKTIYDLLPKKLQHLQTVGRLDKDSSGLLMLTNDGRLTQRLTHPSFFKQKVYEIKLDKSLSESDKMLIEKGVKLKDGISRLKLAGKGTNWTVTMHEGRNRQIRRTFEIVGYKVTRLHRTHFGDYKLKRITSGKFENIEI